MDSILGFCVGLGFFFSFLQWAFLLNGPERRSVPPRKGHRAVAVRAPWQFCRRVGRGGAAGRGTEYLWSAGGS